MFGDMTMKRQRDIFCILPDEIIDAILACLPIRDAVRTDILSSNWRFKCRNMLNLVWDDKYLLPSSDQNNLLNKLLIIVDSVLHLHVGPDQRFQLSVGFPSWSGVNRWITILTRNKVKEIALCFKSGAPYMVPSCLFICESLTLLSFRNCVFKLPASFQQFSELAYLDLRNVTHPGGRLEALVSSFPSLENLILIQIEGPSHLKINSPDLGDIVIVGGDSDDISFVYVPFLSYASIWFANIGDEEKTKTLNILVGLPNIQKLQLGGFAIQRFHGYGSKLIPGRYDHLKSLSVELDSKSGEDFDAALSLFRSFPNLEEVYIQKNKAATSVIVAASTNSWKPKDSYHTFNCLKMVSMSGIIGTQQELRLIQWFLRHAPVLESVIVSIDHENRVIDDTAIYLDLIRHRRASNMAMMFFTEFYTKPLYP